jgi:hypothetical protein
VPNIPRAWKSFWAYSMELLGDVGQVEAPFRYVLEIVLISTQDRCIVWDEHTIGMEIVLHTPDRTPILGQIEARFGLFGDNANRHAR